MMTSVHCYQQPSPKKRALGIGSIVSSKSNNILTIEKLFFTLKFLTKNDKNWCFFTFSFFVLLFHILSCRNFIPLPQAFVFFSRCTSQSGSIHSFHSLKKANFCDEIIEYMKHRKIPKIIERYEQERTYLRPAPYVKTD